MKLNWRVETSWMKGEIVSSFHFVALVSFWNSLASLTRGNLNKVNQWISSDRKWFDCWRLSMIWSRQITTRFRIMFKEFWTVLNFATPTTIWKEMTRLSHIESLVMIILHTLSMDWAGKLDPPTVQLFRLSSSKTKNPTWHTVWGSRILFQGM